MTSQDLGYKPFDADNHYYEALDAFTRHVPSEMQPRVVQWVEMNGRKYNLVGGTISHAVVNPTWDPVAMPGALNAFFKGNPEGKNPMDMLKEREPLPDYYMHNEARVKLMDEQGLSGIWLFPTLGVLYEELIRTDIEACTVMMQAFNRWLYEDWGYAHEDKIFGAPYLCLGDPTAAAAEVEKVVGLGARVVVMRPAPVTVSTGKVSPFSKTFDPVWSAINEAGITVVVHAAASGYSSMGYVADTKFSAGGLSRTGGYMGPSLASFAIERAAQDWLIQSVFEKLYDRFPRLRVASVENGSDFLAPMFRKFDQTAKKSFSWFDDHPTDTFTEKVWMNPFWEDDVTEVTELMGPDHVIFGSDWPHIEGLPHPLDYVVELKGFDPADRKKILLDNVSYLNTPLPA
ncbi:MAG: amidohydrolase family protein [Acidimicrobiaceae bacterium]|nr:amidohydrolase family protein [Acidimicrobiaceae bacterium]MXW60710.1 amidohydrolase family protein [Acidimicrobiaceae bacterium]MXW75251.1 amidohydrolase family protein [Acidimicrobiaceae bacterium]MYA74036.1 amidohydrolase family protein [Acidimicrobiaceae bacterium]MYC42330.1 amidohydrolase family protein [Acidimicrobiaceae bacterium]